ncbi:MAG: cysteine--tRNA ligase [bacterium]|nr:cysteine--tRNA ligase [bacterium]
MTDGLLLYNSRTRKKERFIPIEPGRAGVYSCGPTVYSAQHIGNLRPYLFADLLVRALKAHGLEVTHVINVTDVGHLTDDADAGEDKMEKAAAQSGRRAEEIAAEYTEQWLVDRRRLGIPDPDVLCKATDHIPEQIEMIRQLEAKGATYRIADGIYFDVAKFPRYADLARLDLAQQEGANRIEEVTEKRQPADFALWKFAEKGVQRQQEWDSPWGVGFPGWHIECSAMSTKYLGKTFDIHTGGIDHLPVHHSNEIAQSETALGVDPWVNVWMHEEFIDFQGEKMSKSLGNVYILQDLVDSGFLPLSFRYFFLQAHYRKQQTFTDDAMAAADRGYRRLVAQAQALTEEGGVDEQAVENCGAEFRAAMNDDLNAPRALAAATQLVRDESLSPATRRALLTECDAWLGLGLLTAELPQAIQEADPRIDDLVAARQAARDAKEWAEADRIRDELTAEGVTIEDTPDGPIWRRSEP